jgi:hypothetical protein
METLRQYNLAQRREDKKKMLARPVMLKTPSRHPENTDPSC